MLRKMINCVLVLVVIAFVMLTSLFVIGLKYGDRLKSQTFEMANGETYTIMGLERNDGTYNIMVFGESEEL